MIGNRVNKIRNHLKLSQSDFAKRIGLTKSTISRIEQGENDIKEGSIMLICSEFKINESWLRTGEGEMFNIPSSLIELFGSKVNSFDADTQVILENFIKMDDEERKEYIRLTKIIVRGTSR